MYTGLHVKYPLFLSDFSETWIFLNRCSINTQISNFMKICPVGTELFHADRRKTDRQTWWNYSRFSVYCDRAYKGVNNCMLFLDVNEIVLLLNVLLQWFGTQSCYWHFPVDWFSDRSYLCTLTTSYTLRSWWQWIRIVLKSWRILIARSDRDIWNRYKVQRSQLV
jgi:hypothetical protein